MTTNDASDTISIPPCTVTSTFPLGDKTCEMLAFSKPNNDPVDVREVRLRGHADKASMNEAAFQYFRKYCNQMPAERGDVSIAFPDALDDFGRIQYARRYCGLWRYYYDGTVDGWGGPVRLIRLS
ncbi:MAG: hypothetical protein A2469_04080 [Candidatus Magasanikbacteria bacterium RIFOXYC2_FULL_40_16]|uniref:Uncharacterized protein n=1 Tax=Candidatus Magasanikbacteria bacterium RIFOXYC2_FULL_40_16 TaxID=1798703 RepID=A0A1F6NZY7_9BACT|nr:MAG: hypothetical protein A2469_04080 [Candidatus Magasanikbacteria bacterium RIFOXYC2_FULL_40_16]